MLASTRPWVPGASMPTAVDQREPGSCSCTLRPGSTGGSSGGSAPSPSASSRAVSRTARALRRAYPRRGDDISQLAHAHLGEVLVAHRGNGGDAAAPTPPPPPSHVRQRRRRARPPGRPRGGVLPSVPVRVRIEVPAPPLVDPLPSGRKPDRGEAVVARVHHLVGEGANVVFEPVSRKVVEERAAPLVLTDDLDDDVALVPLEP
eukprot:1918264-Pleurochrysis_carterae.AAC.1